MATIQEVIKRLRYVFTSEGADKVAAELNKVGVAQGNIAATSATTEKAALSLESKFASLERRFNTTVRAQQDFEKVQRQVNAAVAQNPALQERANVVLALAQKHFSNASQGGQAYGRAMEAVQAQVAMLSGRLGVLGTVLTSLGPAGIAVAASIGAAAIAMKLMSDAALQLADRAGKLKDFSETTGFTVIQLQALEKAGAQVGVSAESVNKGLEKFSVSMEAAKQSSGPLYEALLRVNPALAGQIARTDSLAEAWDLLATATRKADLEQRNFIARQAFGRSGIELTRLLGSTAQAGGLKGLIEELKQVDLITAQQAERWDTLGDKISENMKAAKQNIDATFTGPVLESLLQFSNGLLEISRIIRDTDWSKLEKAFQGYMTVMQVLVPSFGLLVQSLKYIQSLGSQQAPAAGSSPLQLTVTPGASPQAAQAEQAKRAREEIIRQYNEMQRWMSVVGSAATVSQQLELRQRALAAAYAEGKIPLDKYRQAYSGLMEEFKVNRIQATVAALGSAATVTEQYQAAVARLQQQLSRGEINKDTFDRAIGGMERERQIQTMRDTIAVLGPLASATDEYKIRVAELEQMLAQGRISQETFNLAVLAANPAFRFATDAGSDFAKTLASGILDGKDAVESLINALDNLAKKLLDSGINDLISGVLSGNLAQAAIGVAKVAGAFLIDMFADETKAQQEAKKKLQEAREQWRELKDQFQDFIASMSGESVGSLTKALRDAEKQMQEFIDAALKAEDYAAARQAQEAFQKFRQDQINEFKATWEAMLQAFDLGLGLDNPFVTAAQKVRDLAKQLKGFIDDTKTAFAIPIMHGDKVVGTTTIISGGASPEEIARATAAVRDYLLTLLSGGAELSDTQKSLLTLQGTAQQLYSTLQDLGMSAAEAADAVNKGIVVALDKLRAAFTDDLTRKINELSGQGYLNSFADLFKQTGQMRGDASALGLGTEDVDRFFALSAQKIVDESKLTGAAFDELMIKFPGLTGLVHEFNGAIARTADELTKARLGIADELFAVVNDTSTIAGQIAALDREFARRREEELKAGGQLLPDLESLYQAKRFKIIEDFNDKAIEEEKRAAKERQEALNSAAKNIVDYINGLVSGPSSTLSPTAILANAQSAYNANLTLAQGGNIDALNKFTSLADNLEKAARAVYASSAGYQNIRNQIIAQGLNLPAVVTSTDPVVQAIRDSIIEMQKVTGNTGATVTAVDTMKSVLNSAMLSGNPANIATALSSYFNSIDTGVDGLIDFNEMKSALGSMASDAALRAMFTTLDTDNSGSLSKLELIRGNTGTLDRLPYIQDNTGPISSIEDNTSATVNRLDTSIGKFDATISRLSDTVARLDAVIGRADTSNTLLDQIRALNDTAASQLTLLKANFDMGAYTTPGVPGSHGGTTIGSDTVNNNMLTALNKIVYNTRQTTRNLQIMLDNGNTYGAIGGVAGVLAAGGWIRGPGGPMDDRAGLYALSNGEHVTNAISARANAPILDAINASRGLIDIRPIQMLPSYSMVANDNYSREIVFELRRLYTRMEQLESRLVAAEMRGAQHVAGAVVESAEVIEDGMNNVARETRLAGEKAAAA